MGTYPSAEGSPVALLLSAGSVEQAGVKDHLGPFTHAFKKVHRRFFSLWPVTPEPLRQTKGVYSKAAKQTHLHVLEYRPGVSFTLKGCVPVQQHNQLKDVGTISSNLIQIGANDCV